MKQFIIKLIDNLKNNNFNKLFKGFSKFKKQNSSDILLKKK